MQNGKFCEIISRILVLIISKILIHFWHGHDFEQRCKASPVVGSSATVDISSTNKNNNKSSDGNDPERLENSQSN